MSSNPDRHPDEADTGWDPSLAILACNTRRSEPCQPCEDGHGRIETIDRGFKTDRGEDAVTGLDETKTCHYCGKKAISKWNACKDCLDKSGDYIEVTYKGLDHPDYHQGSVITITREEDVLESLEHCALSLKKTRQSGRSWKWVIISLHSALQGAMVCHLSGSDNQGALDEKSAKKGRRWHARVRDRAAHDCPPPSESADPPPSESKLDFPKKLFEKLRSQIGTDITKQHQELFTRLNDDYRNELTHFKFNSWNEDTDCMKETVRGGLEIVSLIVGHSDSMEEDRKTLLSKINEIRSLLSAS